MQPRFEPMGVGAILDRTFRLYARNFVPFIAIVAAVQVPLSVLGFGLQHLQHTGGARPALMLAFVFLGVLAATLSAAALVRGVSGAYLGRSVSVGQAYRTVVRKLLTLVGASIAVTVVVGIGFMLCFVPGVIFMLWFALTTQAIVIEDLRAIAGMKRSRALTSGNLGKVFLLLLVAGIITAIVQMGPMVAAIAIARPAVGMPLQLSGSATLATQILQMIGQVLTLPITGTAFILLYYDLRIRKEAFDLEMLAQSLQAGSD